MKTTTYYIAYCGLFDSHTEQSYIDRLDGENDPNAKKADETFWTLYVRENGGPSMAVSDHATQDEAHVALVAALKPAEDDGPKLSDPLGDTPITTTEFFATYKPKYR